LEAARGVIQNEKEITDKDKQCEVRRRRRHDQGLRPHDTRHLDDIGQDERRKPDQQKIRGAKRERIQHQRLKVPDRKTVGWCGCA